MNPSSETPPSQAAAVPASRCYICRGTGIKVKKQKENKKIIRSDIVCPTCIGSGYILRSRRRNEDGSWKKKKYSKSYPSYDAPGPMPRGAIAIAASASDNSMKHLQTEDDEELCYLVGNYRIFQKLDKHRYSTDDLCTTFIACTEAKRIGYTVPRILDIGTAHICMRILTGMLDRYV